MGGKQDGDDDVEKEEASHEGHDGVYDGCGERTSIVFCDEDAVWLDGTTDMVMKDFSEDLESEDFDAARSGSGTSSEEHEEEEHGKSGGSP